MPQREVAVIILNLRQLTIFLNAVHALVLSLMHCAKSLGKKSRPRLHLSIDPANNASNKQKNSVPST